MALYIEDFYQGDTYRIKVEYPIGEDLTGYVHYLALKKDVNDTTPVLQAVSEFGSHSSDSLGDGTTKPVAYIEASATMTDSVPPGKYLYAVKVTAPNADEVTIVPPPADHRDKVLVAPRLTLEI